MKICITGGAGFLGSHIAKMFSKLGCEISIFDSLMWSGYPPPPNNFEFIKASVLDENQVAQIDADHIVHCAATCGVQRCLANPISVLDDYIGTRVLIKRAIEIKAQSFTYLSSSEVLGLNEGDASEEAPCHLWNSQVPRTAYALSKLMSELLIRNSKIPSLILRPFAIYGPGQKGPGVLRNFTLQAVQDKPIQVFNKGKEVRAMCYISDFIDGFSKAFLENHSGVYNLGNPATACSVIEMANTVKKIAGSKSEIVFKSVPYSDKPSSVPNIDKARKDFDFNPRISLDTGIALYAKHLKEQISKVNAEVCYEG